MKKPTNRTSYTEVCDLYESIGYDDYRVRTFEDIKKIHGFDITEVAGYEDLTEENKELYKRFFVKFMNCMGMNIKISIFPYSIHYVKDITFSRVANDPENPKLLEQFGRKVVILKSNGRTKQFKKYFDDPKLKESDATNISETEYLRVDMRMQGSRTWFHIMAEDQWY